MAHNVGTMDTARLLTLVAPVFALIAVGVAARRLRWLGPEADASLLRVTINLFYPCLVFQTVFGNPVLADPRNLLWPPLLGFATVVAGFALGRLGGRLAGLEAGRGLRTFAVTVGLFNYGYIPIPLVNGLFPADTLAVLFVFNVGVELALWTAGILLMAGGSLREGWRRLFNPPVVSLVAAVALTLGLGGERLPAPVDFTLRALAACAVPLGLILIGAVLAEHLDRPRELLAWRTVAVAALLRLGLLPLLFIAAARWLPVTSDLQRVLVVQAAMPAAVFPIVMARHYGGQPLTAVQIVVGTTALALVTIPLWLPLGLRWAGL